jgi:hypothetical protein
MKKSRIIKIYFRVLRPYITNNTFGVASGCIPTITPAHTTGYFKHFRIIRIP